MNKINLLSRLQSFFDSDESKKKKHADDIKSVIKKLKEKQLQTQKKLSQCTNIEFKKVLTLEIDVMSAQIEKGESYLEQCSKELVDTDKK